MASRWPKERRQAGVSFTVHRILGRIEDDEERFAAIKNPPVGKTRWSSDEAKRRVGWTVDNPETPQEKITAIHHLGQDEEVAASVTTEFLKRPQAAAKVSPENKVRVWKSSPATRRSRRVRRPVCCSGRTSRSRR